ncbi:MAG: inositol monophosphatase family protein [Actinomycetota bacterium]
MADTSAPVRNGPVNLDVELLDLATSLARKAGAAVVSARAEAVATATTKSSPTDPVTEGDRLAESIVVAGITENRPDDGIVGEEGTDRTGTSGVVWYIDPIDGTTNYLYDIPAYAVSIGAAVDGVMRIGVVYNPAIDELYAARLGGGATRNGEAISVASPPDLASSLLATGFGYQAERRRHQAAVVAQLLPQVRDIRRMGSAALDLCNAASGRVDAYFEVGLNSWDFAAGWLIAAEAGALVDNLRGAAPTEAFVIAASPAIHAELSDLLRALNADRLGDNSTANG